MAKLVILTHPVQQAWTAAGSISLEMSPKPFTITRLMLDVTANVTTTTVVAFNDPWDRIISSLSLIGGGSKTFFNFTNMRAAYHATRFRSVSTRRPTIVANAQTSLIQHFQYVLHFGVAPHKVDPNTGMVWDNPYDLTAGIPPVGAGNLTLTGTFGAAGAPSTAWVTNSAPFNAYVYGVLPEAGDAPDKWMPRAFPAWTERTPTPTATSGAYATQDNIPAGDFLHGMLLMTTLGANAPRSNAVLGSLKLYDQLGSRDITKFDTYIAAEIITQNNVMGPMSPPPSDDASNGGGTVVLGVPAWTGVDDQGLVYMPVHTQANTGHPLYGADLRGLATGDLQLQYGVASVSTVTFDVLYFKYQLNPDHPSNAGA